MKTIEIKSQKEFNKLPKRFNKTAEIIISAHLEGETVMPSNCNIVIDERGEIDALTGGDVSENRGTIIRMEYGKVSLNQGYILQFFGGKVGINEGVITDFFGGHLTINKKGLTVRSEKYDERSSGIEHFRSGHIRYDE
jgi:hypothetical protein